MLLRRLATERRVLFTLKARRELAGLGLDEEDAMDILLRLLRDLPGSLDYLRHRVP